MVSMNREMIAMPFREHQATFTRPSPALYKILLMDEQDFVPDLKTWKLSIYFIQPFFAIFKTV